MYDDKIMTVTDYSHSSVKLDVRQTSMTLCSWRKYRSSSSNFTSSIAWVTYCQVLGMN